MMSFDSTLLLTTKSSSKMGENICLCMQLKNVNRKTCHAKTTVEILKFSTFDDIKHAKKIRNHNIRNNFFKTFFFKSRNLEFVPKYITVYLVNQLSFYLFLGLFAGFDLKSTKYA